jgi:hypothetical protein
MKQVQFRQQTDLLENPINTEVFGVYAMDNQTEAISVFSLTDEEAKQVAETKVIYVKQNVTNGFRLIECYAFMKNAGLPILGVNWIALMDSEMTENFMHDLQIRWPNENIPNTVLSNSYDSFKDFVLIGLGLTQQVFDETWRVKSSKWIEISEMHKNVKM